MGLFDIFKKKKEEAAPAEAPVAPTPAVEVPAQAPAAVETLPPVPETNFGNASFSSGADNNSFNPTPVDATATTPNGTDNNVFSSAPTDFSTQNMFSNAPVEPAPVTNPADIPLNPEPVTTDFTNTETNTLNVSIDNTNPAEVETVSTEEEKNMASDIKPAIEDVAALIDNPIAAKSEEENMAVNPESVMTGGETYNPFTASETTTSEEKQEEPEVLTIDLDMMDLPMKKEEKEAEEIPAEKEEPEEIIELDDFIPNNSEEVVNLTSEPKEEPVVEVQDEEDNVIDLSSSLEETTTLKPVEVEEKPKADMDYLDEYKVDVENIKNLDIKDETANDKDEFPQEKLPKEKEVEEPKIEEDSDIFELDNEVKEEPTLEEPMPIEIPTVEEEEVVEETTEEEKEEPAIVEDKEESIFDLEDDKEEIPLEEELPKEKEDEEPEIEDEEVQDDEEFEEEEEPFTGPYLVDETEFTIFDLPPLDKEEKYEDEKLNSIINEIESEIDEEPEEEEDDTVIVVPDEEEKEEVVDEEAEDLPEEENEPIKVEEEPSDIFVEFDDVEKGKDKEEESVDINEMYNKVEFKNEKVRFCDNCGAMIVDETINICPSCGETL